MEAPSTGNQWVGYLVGGLVILAVVIVTQMQVSETRREMRTMRASLENSLTQGATKPVPQTPPAPVPPVSSTQEYGFYCDRGDQVLPVEKRNQLNAALERAGFDRLQENSGMYCRRMGEASLGIVVSVGRVCASPSTQDCDVEEHVLRETAPGVLSSVYSVQGGEMAYGTLISEVRAWSPEGVTIRVQELLLEGGCTEEAIRETPAFVDRFIRFSDKAVTPVKTCSIMSCSDVGLLSCR